MGPSYDVLILGAGAAGLFCAFHAARRGRRVLVIEGNPEPGRKVLISGGGRCNFTNLDVRAECFLSENPHFAKSALARYAPRDFLAMVERHGIGWHEKKLGQLFCDRSARQILDMLLDQCREAGVEIVTDAPVQEVREGFRVTTRQGDFSAPRLVVATGGLSIPKLGATGLAYDVARQFGLRIVPPRPALVPLLLAGWEDLAGVSAEVEAACGKRSFRESMLFTHRGLSGPAILQISSYWRPDDAIEIDLVPGHRAEDELLARKRAGERRPPRAVLGEWLPARLAARWAQQDAPLAQLSDAALRGLGGEMQPWRVVPSGDEGFAKAEVTAGGVDTRDLSSQTMEARSVPGLYFIGECVDVTGWLGGYNFQWAWSSGFVAAEAL